MMLGSALAFQPHIPTAPFVAWVQHHQQQYHRSPSLCYSRDCDEIFDANLLAERIERIKVNVLEEELRRPPNPELSPKELVMVVMDGLWNSYDPLPDSGFRLLLRASTKDWRKKILASIGVVGKHQEKVNFEVVASALGAAMCRPHNQFAILVGEEEEYVLDFPTGEDGLDYTDGTSWVECRLRSKADGRLLVMTGWELKQREEDGAWLVDGIIWQDFREAYRPGVGREEWMRVCE
jgi:hypothetical protein